MYTSEIFGSFFKRTEVPDNEKEQLAQGRRSVSGIGFKGWEEMLHIIGWILVMAVLGMCLLAIIAGASVDDLLAEDEHRDQMNDA